MFSFFKRKKNIPAPAPQASPDEQAVPATVADDAAPTVAPQQDAHHSVTETGLSATTSSPAVEASAVAPPSTPPVEAVVETPPPAPVIETVVETPPPAPVIEAVAVTPPPAPVIETVVVTPPPAPVIETVVETPPPAPVIEAVVETPPPAPVIEAVAVTPSPAPASESVVVTPQPAPVVEVLAEISAAADESAPAAKSSWLQRLKRGLSRTGQSLGGLFVGVKVDENLFEELETALIMADAGMDATQKLLDALRAQVRKERLTDASQVKAALRDILTRHLSVLEKPFPLKTKQAGPLVVMIAGVNGAGKTTSIGKLAHAFQRQGASVLLAAGDTFRAAAREQLMAWGARNNVTVIAQDGGDPAAVSFDAVNAGRARKTDVVMVDTAGRLPTQLHLMDELRKIRRVIGKADASAPHEVLLVVDGNSGQNVLAQIRAFDAALNLTGLVVTKLDGTAKGGTLAAVAAGTQGVRAVPVYWIGVGEGLEDLQAFSARDFATALLGD